MKFDNEDICFIIMIVMAAVLTFTITVLLTCD